MSDPIEARRFTGTLDLLPDELLPRNELLRTLVRVFESYGFSPLETPAMEYLDILLGKYGREGEKLIYKLAYKGGEVLALRYDLTVPLSRVIAMHPELPLPFKRYQIQPVWRADTPQPAQGRFREFIQCDVDTVGTTSMVADAENVAIVHDGILALGLEDFVVRLNHRKLLRGIVEWAGLRSEDEAQLLTAVDKLDKIGMSGVRAELAGTTLRADGVAKVLELMEISGAPTNVLDEAGRRLAGNENAGLGLRELRELLEHAAALGVPEGRLSVDLHLTRALTYYTGPIYEVVLEGIERFGSLGGGGRYDDLMGLYGGASLPATGVSIGLSRVLAALLKLGLLKRRSSPSDAYVMRFPDAKVSELLGLCGELRAAGVACEMAYEPERLKKQFQLAERKGIPVVVIAGPDELHSGMLNLKHLASGEQVQVARTEAPARIRELCSRGAPSKL